MDKLRADIAFALGSLARNPAFAAVAILTLGLGIGATTSVFSVADAVVLRPLPFPEPDQLVALYEIDPDQGSDRDTFSGANFLDWKASSESFEVLAAYRRLTWTLVAGDYPQLISGASVTPDFFDVFDVAALRGRLLSPDTDLPGGEAVAIISHAFWRAEFDGAEDAVGTDIELDGTAYTIVGVMPPSFDFPVRPENPVQVWTAARYRVPDPPLDLGEDPAENRGAGYLAAVARLADGVSLEDARAEMSLIAERLAREYPDENSGQGINVLPLREAISGDVRPLLLVLLAAVALVLLIACTNVANLLLARASRRRREVAVRRALGASHWRILRQLLTESVVLAILGGGVGVALARLGTGVVVALAPIGLPGVESATLDLRVLGFALAAVLGAGLLFGIAPAAGLVGDDLQGAVREEGPSVSSGRRHRRLGKLLIVAEVALSLLLVVGAGLMGRTFLTLAAVDPGFDPHDVLVAHVALPDSKYTENHQIVAFYDRVVDELRALPGVESAGSVLTLPMHWNIRGTLAISIEGRPDEGHDRPLADIQIVTPGYLETLRIPMARGRRLARTDARDAPPVALVNEAFVAKYFADDGALGKRITWDDPADPEVEWSTIVGIVADNHVEGLDVAAQPTTYLTYAQAPMRYTTFVVRSTMDAEPLTAALRRVISEIDPEQPVSGISTMDDVLRSSLGDRRFNMVLLGSFAGAALLMAAVGLYGVLSFSVSQRTHEIGLRRALGAAPRGVVGLVVGEGLRLVAVGLLLGAGGVLLLGRFIAGQLYGVSAIDPFSFAAGILLVAGVALVACVVPARRAAGTDPMVALRRG